MLRTLPLLLMTALLAGCLGGDDPDPDPDPLNVQPDDPASDLTPRLTLDRATGVAPLEVVFSIDAAGALDPGNVTWDLTATTDGSERALGNGTGVPADATHTFQAGDHLVRLELHEGGVTVNQTVQVVVTAAGQLGGGGGEAENATNEARGAVEHSFQGTMATGTDPESPEVQTFALPVPEGIQAATVWGRWSIPTPLGSLSTPAADLEVYLKDPSGATVYTGNGHEFEYGHLDEPLAPGDWTVEVEGLTVPVDTPFQVDVLLWRAAPAVQTVTGSFAAGADVQGQEVGDAPAAHAVEVPTGAQAVAARLTWLVPEAQAAFGGPCWDWDRASDLDLAGSHDAATLSSSNFLGCEFGFATGEADLGGSWAFTVVPYSAAHVEYTLTVFTA